MIADKYKTAYLKCFIENVSGYDGDFLTYVTFEFKDKFSKKVEVSSLSIFSPNKIPAHFSEVLHRGLVLVDFKKESYGRVYLREFTGKYSIGSMNKEEFNWVLYKEDQQESEDDPYNDMSRFKDLI